MEVFVRHLKVLWTAERMLGELKLRVLTHKIALGALAALAGLFGLGMLNLAAFFTLQPHMGPAVAALIVALGNIVFAGLLVAFANKLAPGPETKIVEDVRDMALADIEAEAQALQAELRMVRDEVLAVHSTLTHLIKNPLEAFAPKAIIPLIATATHLIKNWDTSRTPAKPAPEKPAPAKPAAKKRAPAKRKTAASTRRKTKT